MTGNRTLATIRFSLVLVLTVVGSGCMNDSDERGRDPWVFRSVLDWQPRMVTFALAEDFWVSYQTDNAALYRVWSDGVSFEGPVYNQSHGPQPVSLGNAFVSAEPESPWSVEVDGQSYSPAIEYGGHRFADGEAELLYTLVLSDGSSVNVAERPERTGPRTLRRTFSVDGLSDLPVISVRIEMTSLDSADAYETNGEMEIVESSENSFVGVLRLNGDQPTFIETTFTEDPPIETVILPPGQPADRDDRPSGLVLIEASDCSVCHNQTLQTVGPSYAMIAERYANSSYNASKLAGKIMAGGSGEWGDVAMTAHPDISREDALEKSQYILSLDGEPLANEEPSSRESYPLNVPAGENDDRVGVVIDIYRFSEPVREMPESVDSFSPVYSAVIPGVYAVDNDDFGEYDEDFYAEISGNIVIDESSNYVFRLISDDGSIMYLDGVELINNDGLHSARPVDGEVYLEAGEHPFTITFFQGAGGKALALQWIRHGEEVFSKVPSEVFRYDPENLKETKPFVPRAPFVPGIPGDGLALNEVHPSFDLATIRPDSFHPMVGGLGTMSDGRIVVSTWDPEGSVYLLDNIDASNRNDITVTKIASGLLEPLGLTVVDDVIYVLQKHELTRLGDTDGDGIIDMYETVCAGWGVSSNFHEFAFGLVYKDGYFYATLATAILPGGASAQPQVPDRGKVIKIDPVTGDYEFVASGLRTPNGIGIGVDDELFVADNQGDWLPSSKILHVTEGAFFGSRSVDFEGTRTVKETPPVVWLPQDEIGNSPSQPAKLTVGQYAGQMVHGEVTHGGLKRVFAEKVDGKYQGAVFRFVQGLEAGVNRLVRSDDGSLLVGGIGNPGNWGHEGKQWYGLQRLTFNGETTFEMLAIEARTGGFDISFTEAIDDRFVLDPETFNVHQWKYVPTAEYGGPKVDEVKLPVSAITVDENRTKVFLEIPGLKAGSVLYIYVSDPLRSESDRSLWTTEAWYTLNRLSGIKSSVAGIRRAEKALENTLTESEVAEGWELLFDGKKIDKWVNYGKNSIGSAWRVENGALVLDGRVVDWQFENGSDIVTREDYSDFELSLEWKISAGGNSGIFFNVVVDTSRYTYPWETGPEMQILDDARHSDGRIVSHRSGDLYDMVASPGTPTRPVGEWNQVYIRKADGNVEHWLNGNLMVEYPVGDSNWRDLIARSKFASMDGFGATTSGRIGLQDHGNRVAFRNIKVRRLDAE
ncbi:MAG: DUF1080 domain-containing protein [Rhodothermales bacterium]|nr:DUF1080 domain-containing protein [Rhodothermales bacterium]